MSRYTDQRYLLTEQYQDAANLRARIALHERFSVNRYPFQRWVFDRLAPLAGPRVLEIGCGPGDLWRWNRDRLPADWTIVLTDLSIGMLREARQGLGGWCSFAVADAQALPFAAGSFDAVIANHMLYHVPDRPRAYAEIARVLCPGGHLLAATNGRNHLRELHELRGAFGSALRSTLPMEGRGFTLENGAEELGRVFSSVTLHRYDDALVVTEAEPLVEYVLSTITPSDDRSRTREIWRDLLPLVQRLIEDQGAMHISKDTGLFDAVRGA